MASPKFQRKKKKHELNTSIKSNSGRATVTESPSIFQLIATYSLFTLEQFFLIAVEFLPVLFSNQMKPNQKPKKIRQLSFSINTNQRAFLMFSAVRWFAKADLMLHLKFQCKINHTQHTRTTEQ